MRAMAERLPSGATTASSTPGTREQRAAQGLQALGLDAVVVGEQDPHAVQHSRGRRPPTSRCKGRLTGRGCQATLTSDAQRRPRTALERGLSRPRWHGLGVSRQTINAIETGRYLPSLPLAIGLARFFETAVDDLFQPEPERSRDPAAASTSRCIGADRGDRPRVLRRLAPRRRAAPTSAAAASAPRAASCAARVARHLSSRASRLGDWTSSARLVARDRRGEPTSAPWARPRVFMRSWRRRALDSSRPRRTCGGAVGPPRCARVRSSRSLGRAGPARPRASSRPARGSCGA